MVLDYGARKFIVRLDDDLALVLTTEDGKTIKSLPDARADEDEEQVQEATASHGPGFDPQWERKTGL